MCHLSLLVQVSKACKFNAQYRHFGLDNAYNSTIFMFNLQNSPIETFGDTDCFNFPNNA